MIQATITQLDNGYTLHIGPVGMEEEEGFTESAVFEVDVDERETFGRVVVAVAEHFGFGYNKFAEDNLHIFWDKAGHKTEAGEKAEMDQLTESPVD